MRSRLLLIVLYGAGAGPRLAGYSMFGWLKYGPWSRCEGLKYKVQLAKLIS